MSGQGSNYIERGATSEYSEHWKEVADSEFRSLMDNETWELVDSPEDREIIGCKWVSQLKYRSDGQIEQFKDRLVAQGLNQT